MDNFSIRRAALSDSDFYFALRNDPAVRAASFRGDPIARDVHEQWFGRKLHDPRARMFVLEDRVPVGQVRIDLSDDGSRGTINVAVLPAHHGKGYASRGVALSCAAVFREFPALEEIVALIKKGNVASLKTFEKNHFTGHDEMLHDGMPTIKMILPRSELRP